MASRTWSAVPHQENLLRVARLFALFVGVGYLGYLLLLSGDIAGLAPRMASWWTPTMVILVFGPGLALGIVAARRHAAGTRWLAATAALTFLVAVATWPMAWDGSQGSQLAGVWLAAFHGLASLAAVVAWPAWIAVVHMVVGCVGVQLINFALRTDVPASMLVPEILFAIMFCSLFVGGAVMAFRTGRLLDETTDETHADAAEAAAQRAFGGTRANRRADPRQRAVDPVGGRA
ncbi:hypothetical protein MUG78_05730 [Gordonia alkaliphila]|uniref:hypothetical protein n=1 Tax=Gordonia alkaliphila TaxID=1053547 RepID=UPI001FF21083|nr:hypothetical protein [Gordonia alkaliphila]MCK0438977.1 hypothetical protein [Gordonia alkaliphila]